MTLSVLTNSAAMVAQQSSAHASQKLESTQNRLSTGLKIISSADNPSGRYIANNLRVQVSLYQQASQNIATASGLGVITSGAYAKVIDTLSKAAILAENAMSYGTNDSASLSALDTNYTGLKSLIDNISATTQYNGNLLTDTAHTFSFQVGIGTSSNDSISLSTVAVDSTTLGLDTSDLTTSANAALALDAIKTAINTVSDADSAVGSALNNLDSFRDSTETTKAGVQLALSAIQDTDYGQESAELAKSLVVRQVALQMLSKAANSTQDILTLIRQ